MKIHLLLGLVIFVAVLMVPVSDALLTKSAILDVEQVKYEPYPASAGKYVKIFINVRNTGNLVADEVVCELDPRYPFSLDPDEEARISIGELEVSKNAVLEYRVRVDEDAVSGNNELRMNCDPEGLDDGIYTVHKLNIDVRATRPEFAVGSVSSVPEDMRSGNDDVKLTVHLQNIGEGDAKLTTAKLRLPSGFHPSDSYSDRYSIGPVNEGSTGEAIFYIDVDDDIMAGLYKADLVVSYKDDNINSQREQNLDLDMRVKSSPNLVIEEVRAGANTGSDSFTGYVVRGGIEVNSSDVSQGSSGELRITVVNEGDEEAKSVSVKIFRDPSQPIEFGEIYDFVGNLEPGKSGDAVFRFTIDGNAVLKEYLIDAELRYVEGDDVITEPATVSLDVALEGSDYTLLVMGVLIVLAIVLVILWRRRAR
jgi:hypothetical protein